MFLNVGTNRPMARDSDLGANNAYGVDPNDKLFADKIQAARYSRTYDEYLRDYQPLLEGELANVGSERFRTQQVDSAVRNVRQGLARMPAQRDRLLKSYGLSQTPEESAVSAKSDALQGALAEVTAINRTNDAIETRDWNTVVGGRSPRSGLAGFGG